MGRALVDPLADYRIAALREVASAQRDHADEAIVLVPDAQVRREKLSAFAVRSGARFQPGATDGFARNDDWAKRPTALHWFLSLTHRVETTAATLGFRFFKGRWRGAVRLNPLIGLQEARLEDPPRLRVQPVKELRLKSYGQFGDADAGR